jgi:hypothetical protein
MRLHFKGDWSESAERWKAWWAHELTARPMIQVTSPKDGADPSVSWDGWSFARRPEEPEASVNLFDKWCGQTFFGGDAFPNLWVNYGPGILAAFLGARPRFATETVWFEDPRPWEKLKDIRVDRSGKWWKIVERTIRIATEEAQGKFMVGMTDLGSPTDVAASLRGSQALMRDLFREGERVKGLCWRILDEWLWAFDQLSTIVQASFEGSGAWMGLWSPKRWYPLQCDYAYMLSPSKFSEFALPFIRRWCSHLDHSIYHLDGQGQIIHLNALLDIPELDGIQWVPGDGSPPCSSPRWFPLYRRIQGRGRLLVLSMEWNHVLPVLRQISPRGLMIQAYGCPSEKVARQLLGEVESLSTGNA